MKKITFLKIGTCLAIFAATLALAAGSTATLTWQLPTQYIDGTALPATDIAFSTVTWVHKINGKTGTLQFATNTGTAPGLSCGDYTFSVTVTTSKTAKFPNATSSPSSSVDYDTGIICAPSPATGLIAK